MARGDTAARLIRVIAYLETHPRGLTAPEIHAKLADEGFECSHRTIYRDLEVIQKAYFPVVSEGVGEASKWKLQSVAVLNEKIQFSYHELMALFLARESLQALRGTALFNHINNFISRLERALGSGAAKELQNLSHFVAYRSSSSWQTGVAQEVLDTVYDGCYEGYILNVEYKSKTGDSKNQVRARLLGPEGLFFADSGVYLIALDLETNTHKTYSLSRITSVVRTEDHFETKNFSLKNYLKDGIGIMSAGDVQEVQIFIEEPIASYVSERRWHETQQIVRVHNGIELKLNVRVNDELARWVLGLGPSARIISPNQLREKILEMNEQIKINNSNKKVA